MRVEEQLKTQFLSKSATHTEIVRVEIDRRKFLLISLMCITFTSESEDLVDISVNGGKRIDQTINNDQGSFCRDRKNQLFGH